MAKYRKPQANSNYFQNSEYIGVDGEEVLEAKCLSNLTDVSDEDFDLAIRGICQLWASYSGRRKDAVIDTSPHKFSGGERHRYFLLLLDIWLAEINLSIDRYLVPVFDVRKVKTPYFKGKVDLLKSHLVNLGLIGDLQSQITELSFNSPHLRVLRDAFEVLANSKILKGGGILEKKVQFQILKGINALKSIPASRDFINNAVTVLRDRVHLSNGEVYFPRLPKKLKPLSPVIDFALDLILSSDFNLGKNGLSVRGIKFNLNYLLQFILTDAMRLVGGATDDDRFNEGKINNIRHINKTKDVETSKWMSPDCYGLIKKYKGDRDLLYILDAKHKSFFLENTVLNRISREDYFQVISYASTHAKQNIGNGPTGVDFFYGLVGLAKEETINRLSGVNSFRYIQFDKISAIEIDYDVFGQSVQKKIYAIPFRFAQFLFDAGKANRSDELLVLIKKLGEEMLRAFDELRIL